MIFQDYQFSQYLCILVIGSFCAGAWIQTGQVGYGKHFKSLLSATINPQLGWFLFEIPNLIMVSYFLFNTKGMNLESVDSVAIALFTIHYINRDIIYPLRISSKTRALPIEVTLSAMIFTSFNGYLQASTHFIDQSDEELSLRSLFGCFIFFLGMFLNIQSDQHLQYLKSKGEGKYLIPSAGLFQLVSSAHYFAEIVEWFGYFLVSMKVSSLCFFLSTLIILSQRALTTHQWYKKQFKEYPKERKAVIPYIL